jgi:hypothetical protein
MRHLGFLILIGLALPGCRESCATIGASYVVYDLVDGGITEATADCMIRCRRVDGGRSNITACEADLEDGGLARVTCTFAEEVCGGFWY